MKIRLSIMAMSIGLAIILAGCSEPVLEEDFEYRIYAERDDYREGDEVKLIAELKYVGERESVTINHAATPFHYLVSESSGKYTFIYVMDQPLIYTTLKRGEPLVHEYTGNGSYLKNEEGEPLFGEPLDVPYPAGDYEVKGYAEFNVGAFQQENEGEFKVGNELISFQVSP